MDRQILAINTRIPPRKRNLVHRDRLVDAIERAASESRFVLVSAPAGYGKSTLLADWAQSTERSVAWVNVEPECNDPERFLRYLATAWETIDPGVRDSPIGILLEPMSPNIDAVMRACANHAAASSPPVAFVLDDIHLIEHPDANDALAFLIEHLPPDFTIVAATRGEPLLPLARFRARDLMRELGTDHLAFQTAETREFMQVSVDTAPSDGEIERLQAATEGWIAGLQLFTQGARALQPDVSVAARSGRHRRISSYFRDEVLAGLQGDYLNFLSQVCIFDHLCAPLCDAVTGARNSQSMLDELERANLFLQPMDDERHWFRLYPLLVEVLESERKDSSVLSEAQLHARAAHWYLDEAMVDDAFRHAVAGADLDLVQRIAEDYVVMKLESGEFRTVQRWVELVPDAWYAMRPELNFLRVAFCVFSGDVGAGIRIMDELETSLAAHSGAEMVRFLAKLAVARCAIACFMDEIPKAEAYGAQALRDLDETDITFRANTHHALADSYRRHGRWNDARNHYMQVLDLASDPAITIRSAHVYGALADLELRQGHLHEAERFWRKDIESIEQRENWGKLPVPIIGWAYIRYGELLYAWNLLAEAEDQLSRGMQRAELGGDVKAIIAGSLLASKLRLASGDIPAAAEFVKKAEEQLGHSHFPEWKSSLDWQRALLWVADDNKQAAMQWCSRVMNGGGLANPPESQESYLAVAHLSISFGAGPEKRRAREILSEQLEMAEIEGRRSIQIASLALQALELRSQGDEPEAMMRLERALRIGEPEGPVRLFLELGAPMWQLLRAAKQRGVCLDYVSRLLASDAHAPAYEFQEQLSDRELEILRQMAAGLTNREIGDRLYISAETVKKHIGNIYAKLGVHRRVEASARARELGILP